MKANDVEIQHNVDELNKALKRIAKLHPNLAKNIINRIAWGVYGDLVEKTPIDTGTARHHWKIQALADGLTYEISNNVGYILYLEYGVKGHPLSTELEKRMNSLKYMFATGILVSDGMGGVIYTYTPKEQHPGFIRETLREWQTKGLTVIKNEITQFLLKETRGLRK